MIVGSYFHLQEYKLFAILFKKVKKDQQKKNVKEKKKKRQTKKVYEKRETKEHEDAQSILGIVQ